uniref:NADH dehydrogenase subunit 6 n=1 Tax=Leontynka pallida TaxID=2912034 RepID=UPI002028F22C|nr:NADH dehydrogenase subunit 6 [Leontynka pallida]UPQ43830.1 NADH dehydrogenase subunit 6 [Leontynka pallida]
MYFLICLLAHCALLSIGVSWTRSPFMALMFAVMLFTNASIAMLMLGFEFLALLNMLVYVGALAVLFLFVIMLLELPATELRAYNRGWSTLALAGVLASRAFTAAPESFGFTPSFEALTFVGHALYVRYADLLILNSLVLTVALFGALVLAHLR